jgi:hypothetical protein
MMPMIESMMAAPISVLLRFGRHDDILAMPRPPEAQPVVAAWWQFARIVALARKGRANEAAAERPNLDALASRVAESALFGGTGLETARTILALAGQVADARIAWARGDRDAAIAAWTRAAAAVDRVPYDEPPIWFYPIRESLGAALLSSGRMADAERAFREDLARHPRNARSLFGLHAALVKQGRDGDAAWVRRAFDEAWKDADVTLTIESL